MDQSLHPTQRSTASQPSSTARLIGMIHAADLHLELVSRSSDILGTNHPAVRAFREAERWEERPRPRDSAGRKYRCREVPPRRERQGAAHARECGCAGALGCHRSGRLTAPGLRPGGVVLLY